MAKDDTVVGRFSRDQLFQMIEEQPPRFAGETIEIFDSVRYVEIEPFIQEYFWEDQGSVPLGQIVGVSDASCRGLTWQEFLQRGRRMDLNLVLLEQNPEYYGGSPEKKSLSYLRIDDGGYYAYPDGEHRTCIAKFFGFFNQVEALQGVTVSLCRLDHEALALFHVLQARGFHVRAVRRKLGREDNPGWMRETFAVEFEIGVNGQKLMFDREEARQILARPQGWWSRFLKRLGG